MVYMYPQFNFTVHSGSVVTALTSFHFSGCGLALKFGLVLNVMVTVNLVVSIV